MAVETRYGRLEGYVKNGVHAFLGIPFAAPPFGPDRFRPPRPPACWDGVRDATRYGASCPQALGPLAQRLPEPGEDCLNLNVWTPDPGTAGLPVMVFAHGGGQVSGSGSDPLYDGTRFAQEGVVLVTNNRRLGAEGFLHLGDQYDDERGSGSFGIQDQLAALRWVQENIEQFGGDPGRVTLFGESGGGATTGAVMASPSARGLLHRALPQSGGHAAHTPEQAGRVTRRVLELLGLAPGDYQALAATPWQRFVDLYGELGRLDLDSPQVFLPVLGEGMPLEPADATHAGLAADLDLLIGTCRDEARLFAALSPSLDGSPFDRRARLAIERSGGRWEDVLAAYRRARPGQADRALALAVMGDVWFRAPSLRIADGHALHAPGRTFMYLFTWESPRAGAAHALDLLVFGNGVPFAALVGDAPHDAVERTMRRAWTRFAATGAPGLPELEWPAYDPDRRLTMELCERPRPVADPCPAERAALAGLIGGSWTELGL